MYEKLNIRHVLHAGDLSHGIKVYRGQANESYAHTWETQLAAVEARLPRLPGLDYRVLGGNHDYSWWTEMGADFIAAVARRRDDVIAVGYDAVTIPLLADPPVAAHLWHGHGARPYALSYPVQRYVERGLAPYEELQRVADGIKKSPDIKILVVGHFHRRLGGLGIGSIECWMPGCFEARNAFTRRLGLWPDVGGWALEIQLDKRGGIISCRQEWINAPVVENDYANYPIPRSELGTRQTEAVFHLSDTDGAEIERS